MNLDLVRMKRLLAVDETSMTATLEPGLRGPEAAKYRSPEFEEVREHLAAYRVAHPERLESAYFAGEGPCTLLIDEIEGLWEPIAEHDDWSRFDAKLPEVKSLGFDDGFIRVWRFYLAACIAAFEVGRTDVSQFRLAHA